ncbi:hypothetical protein [Faecalibacterium prausnitzii]|uniref:Uncharacterized protein n=1 Tax=Faecalibacterium prausnitzii TaxID=853 RepID=A0A844DB57_9FIRM|nr:hypothetical protein [Faecalibacterium prausnitzii]MBS6196741.1 hypothetical protein [Oscillibacter sp.]MSC50831.1 hypothetical protein [Faecalibacterium prausnitzii]
MGFEIGGAFSFFAQNQPDTGNFNTWEVKMGFYDEAVHVLETIARALNGAFSYGSMADFYNRSTEKAPICPEFSKTAVRMKKHIRPPVRAEPERGLLQSKNQTDNISTCFLNSRRILL